MAYYRWLIDNQPEEHVLRGAIEHGLPPDYVEDIRATPSIDDHDDLRHRRELAIYPDQPSRG